jgi:hypothetical protein
VGHPSPYWYREIEARSRAAAEASRERVAREAGEREQRFKEQQERERAADEQHRIERAPRHRVAGVSDAVARRMRVPATSWCVGPGGPLRRCP